MPIFKIPPVGPEDGGDIHEVVREIVGNRNYSPRARFGEGRAPRGDNGEQRLSLWRRIRLSLRR